MIRALLLFLFAHRTVALARWDFHFLGVRARNVLLGNRRKLDQRLKQAASPVYLNLGSGPRGIDAPNWINVDGYPDRNVHYCLDLNRSLPFSNDTFDGIFCEHVLEHFNLEQGRLLLQECLRILRPGGCVRLIVPDGARILRSYCDAPEELLQHREVESGVAMEAVNSYFRQRYEHQCIYDKQLLGHILSKVGFDSISRVTFREGVASSCIMLDDEKYAWESLYMEASKPR
jgi:predicted SAM-dependent methyltransferase